MLEDLGVENGGVIKGIKIPLDQSDEWCLSLKRPVVLQLYSSKSRIPPLLVPKTVIAMADKLALSVSRIHCDMHSTKHLAPLFSFMEGLLKTCKESPLGQPSKHALYLVLAYEMASTHHFLHNYTYVQSFTGLKTSIVDAFTDFMSALVAYVLLNTQTEGLNDLELSSYRLALQLISAGKLFSSDSGIARKHYEKIKTLANDYEDRQTLPGKAPSEALVEKTSLAEVIAVFNALIEEHGEELPGGGSKSKRPKM